MWTNLSGSMGAASDCSAVGYAVAAPLGDDAISVYTAFEDGDPEAVFAYVCSMRPVEVRASTVSPQWE